MTYLLRRKRAKKGEIKKIPVCLIGFLKLAWNDHFPLFAKSNVMKSACNSCRVVYTARYSKMSLSLPRNLGLSASRGSIWRCTASTLKVVPCSPI